MYFFQLRFLLISSEVAHSWFKKLDFTMNLHFVQESVHLLLVESFWSVTENKLWFS